MPTSDTQTSYDRVPYPSGGLSQTHPEHLATLALLMGMNPPDVSDCRVLELGCGDGSNLIPLALALPKATFVGIDLSKKQIEQGKREVESLGIGNLSLLAQDLLDFDTEQPPFDYILAHGIYSWVPKEVRSGIWDIFEKLLSKNGVAYLSYNTFPGWHYRLVGRDMMRFHTQHIDSPDRIVAQALAMMDFVADAIPNHLKVHLQNTKNERDRLREHPPNYLLHDDLGEINQPFYFHEVIETAAVRGFQFLSETEFFSMQDHSLSQDARAMLQQFGDALVMEQYRDFLMCKMFRQTLFCRSEHVLHRSFSPSFLSRFLFRSAVACQSETPQFSEPVEETFSLGAVSISIADPVAKSALHFLAQQHPRAVPFSELFEQGLSLCARNGHADTDEPKLKRTKRNLCEMLLALYGAGVVSVHVFQAPFSRRTGSTPNLEPFTRLRLEADREVVTPLLENIRFEEPFGRAVALLCDGKRTLDDLVDALVPRAVDGEFPNEDIPAPSKNSDDAPLLHTVRKYVETRAKECLERLSSYGVFALG